jgi:hypothetical protein
MFARHFAPAAAAEAAAVLVCTREKVASRNPPPLRHCLRPRSITQKTKYTHHVLRGQKKCGDRFAWLQRPTRKQLCVRFERRAYEMVCFFDESLARRWCVSAAALDRFTNCRRCNRFQFLRPQHKHYFGVLYVAPIYGH